MAPRKQSVSFETPEDDINTGDKPFERALKVYIDSRPKKSKTPKFIEQLKSSQKPYSKDDVQRAIKQLESATSNKKSTQIVRQVLKPVIRVLSDYSAIIDTLAQADPMPTSLIWGSLKVVINSSQNFLDLYEKISDQLEAVEQHLSRLVEYEELFGESKNMQALLEKSYIYILQFWHRVEKECSRHVVTRMAMSLASINVSKLDRIIANIKTTADHIGKLVPIVQARIDRGERENAVEERERAGIARHQIGDMHEQMLQERKEHKLEYIRKWLKAGSDLFESNAARHQEKASQAAEDTCRWISKDDKFDAWLNAREPAANLWIQAAPGFGKSVACASAIQLIADSKPSTGWAYQYYSFDQEFTQLQVYRNFAVQLVERLWSTKHDIPEVIYQHAQGSGVCVVLDHARTMINLLVEHLGEVYIFLDGLDEECEIPSRLSAVRDTIGFLTGLQGHKSRAVHVWFSSQHRQNLETSLNHCQIIQMNKALNGGDIELHLSRRMSKLNSDDFDEGFKHLILDELLLKADGCFLWADLMFDSISENAWTLKEVQQRLHEGLPEVYEDYYKQRLLRVDTMDIPFVVTVLSCIVFAKRPLRLVELREATATVNIDDGQMVEKSNQMLRGKLVKCCEPLVRVRELGPGGQSNPLCVLSHGTVRSFLLKNPDIFSGHLHRGAKRGPASVSEEVLANACLRYLFQPSYGTLLSKDEDTFKDEDGKDITEQRMLPYAAKYWDKHLDDIVGHRGEGGCQNPDSYCYRAKRFIHSPQFTTCLQVQSLLVEGQFQFWYASGQLSMGPQIKRALPRWLAMECFPSLQQDYAFFIGEWGYFLDCIANATGPLSGEIDRCFWTALGPFHFLRETESRYRSFMLSTDHQPINPELHYYDAISVLGNESLILSCKYRKETGATIRFEIQLWRLNHGSFEWTSTQSLDVAEQTYTDYTHASKNQSDPDAASVVSFDADLRAIRLGSSILVRSPTDVFEVITMENDDIHIDNFAYHDGLVAISGSKMTRPKAKNSNSEEGHQRSKDLEATQDFEPSVSDDYESVTSSYAITQTNSIDLSRLTSRTSTSLLSGDATKSKGAETTQPIAERTIETKLRIAGREVEERDDDEQDNLSIDESSVESDGNSAQMSWSEASSRASSDLDQADDWNDWDDRDNLEGMDQLAEDDGDELNMSVKANLIATFDDEVAEEDLSEYEAESESDPDETEAPEIDLEHLEVDMPSPDDGSVDSNFSAESDTDDESGSDSEDGQGFDALLNRTDKKGRTRRMYLRVHDTRAESKGTVFRFTHETRGRIYSSPPVFHPHQPLLVWPLGDEEVLFADVFNNTYFTRLLSRSTHNSCHVFVKAHFSSDGRYLHFAALEASVVTVPEEREGPFSNGQELYLNLQVTTHQLSSGKTTRAPPWLIHRINVPLGRRSRLNTSDLPFEITWRPQEVFITRRNNVLDVARVPLFPPHPGAGDADEYKVRYMKERIHLPRTALQRAVRYIPPSSATKPASIQYAGASTHAVVLLGGNSSDAAKSKWVPPVQTSPPIGVFLDEKHDLGGWHPRLNRDVDEEARKKQKKRTAGRLRDMYETFDRNEDCDIVPYLF